jgi:membrane protein YqaA with SNARE-associated domain
MLDTTKLDTHVEKVINTRTVTRAQSLMGSRSGLWLIGMVSFVESALPVPIITDPFMVAGILANRSKAALVVGITLVSSIIGGITAFVMARYFFGWLELMMTTGIFDQFQNLILMDSSNTLVVTLIGSVTPIPYTVTAWVIAVGEGSLLLFIVASVFGRGIRYGIIGVCTYRFGPRALTYARRSLGLTSVAVLLFVGLYIWLKL